MYGFVRALLGYVRALTLRIDFSRRIAGPLNPAAMDVGIARVPQHEKPIISPLIIFSVLMGGSLSPFAFSFAADAFTAKILPGVLVVLAGVQLVLFAIVPRKA